VNNIQTFNVYCDESCHMEHDRIPTMALGATYCPSHETRNISKSIRSLKVQHKLSNKFEAKWTKVSPAKGDFYLALLDLFLDNDLLRFRGLVVPDKNQLDHARFRQSHDDWYYKMYFTMLKKIVSPSDRYRIYLDIKDTRGGKKTRELHRFLADSIQDSSHQCIERVQQMRSHESELLQITDLLIGALTYSNRGIVSSTAKTDMIARLQERLGTNALAQTSPLNATKFNILVWNPQE